MTVDANNKSTICCQLRPLSLKRLRLSSVLLVNSYRLYRNIRYILANCLWDQRRNHVLKHWGPSYPSLLSPFSPPLAFPLEVGTVGSSVVLLPENCWKTIRLCILEAFCTNLPISAFLLYEKLWGSLNFGDVRTLPYHSVAATPSGFDGTSSAVAHPTKRLAGLWPLRSSVQRSSCLRLR